VDANGDWFAAYPKLSIHRIQVLLSIDETRAIFVGKSSHEADLRQLTDVAAELGTTVVVKTERFGHLTLDRSIDWFEGTATWNGESVRIIFCTDESHDISAGLKIAEKLWEQQTAWKQRVDDFAVQELLPIKNDSWLGDGEMPLTPAQFKSRMTLESISVAADGRIEFWHHDGDLFLGHSIQISGSLDEGLTQADIPG
jgi:hypothetical protein